VFSGMLMIDLYSVFRGELQLSSLNFAGNLGLRLVGASRNDGNSKENNQKNDAAFHQTH